MTESSDIAMFCPPVSNNALTLKTVGTIRLCISEWQAPGQAQPLHVGEYQGIYLTLMHLLNEMRADGHDVSAPWDEFIAMREALISADKALEKIYMEALQVNFRAASTAGINRRKE